MSRLLIGPTSIKKNIAVRWKHLLNATVAMAKSRRTNMRPVMVRPTLTSVGLAIVLLPALIYGGIFYFLLIAIFLVGSAWEYIRIYRTVRCEPNEVVTIGGVLLIATARFFFARAAILLFVLLILTAMTIHLVAYERGREQAGFDFTI